jgi:hypothetical protein
MKGSGGTEGGVGLFFTGFVLSAVALYFFFDSIRVTAGGHGFFTGIVHQQLHGSFETGSMGLVFLPFFMGVIALFYDSNKKWAWWLMYSGLGILVIEMLSKIRFLMNTKSSHLLILMAVFAAGAGMMIRSYKETTNENNRQK